VKKYIVSLLTLICIFVFICCQNSTQMQSNTAEQTTSSFSIWDTILYAEIEKAFYSAFPEKSEVIHYQNYSQALSEQELQQTKNMARAYYENEYCYDLLSLKAAENDCHWYYDYPQYQQGDIIIFKAETTHAGEGTYRYIVIARDNSSKQWKQINEGY